MAAALHCCAALCCAPSAVCAVCGAALCAGGATCAVNKLQSCGVEVIVSLMFDPMFRKVTQHCVTVCSA